MASVFTRIINGELPGHFVYEDKTSVAFLSINPVTDGHVLVIPRKEVDKWTDLDAETWLELNKASHLIGKAVVKAFDAPRAGVLLAGFEVPHAHIHVFPAHDMQGFDLSTAAKHVDQDHLAANAEKIRDALVEVAHESK